MLNQVIDLILISINTALKAVTSDYLLIHQLGIQLSALIKYLGLTRIVLLRILRELVGSLAYTCRLKVMI